MTPNSNLEADAVSTASAVKKNGEDVVSILILICLLTLSIVLMMRSLGEINEYNTEAFRVPMIVLGLVAILSTILAVMIFRKMALEFTNPFRSILETDSRFSFALLSVCCLAVMALPVLGFLLTGAVFFPIAAFIVGRVTAIPALLFAAVTPLVIYFSFGEFFSVWLPGGHVFEG